MAVLLQHGADPSIRNTDGRTALDLAEASAKAVLTGEWIFALLSLLCVSCCAGVILYLTVQEDRRKHFSPESLSTVYYTAMFSALSLRQC